MNYQHHFSKSIGIKEVFWKKIGKLHTDVLAPVINPSFSGNPSWPSLRQAFQIIETPEGTIITTDGLSDPYEDFDINPENQNFNGIGCELYIETKNNNTDLDSIKNTWEFQVLYQVAQLAASNPNIATIFEQYTFLSTELYDCSLLPKEYINNEGRCAVLLGLPSSFVPATLELSLEKIKIVNIKLLHLSELKYIQEKGAEGRMEIANLIQKQNDSSKSFLERKPVI